MGKRKFSDEWKVLEHGPLEQLADNLWWVSGALPDMTLRRTMVVVRREDGTLVVHNGIAMREETQQQLESLGTPSILIVPNGWHRLDAAAYKKRYPALRVFAPAGARKKVEEAVPVDGAYEQFPADSTVRLETLHGMKEAEGAMIVTSSDGTTVVLNDAVFNMDKKRDFWGRLYTTVLGSAPGPRISRLMKLIAIKDQRAFRSDLERYASLPDLVRFIVAHEKVAHGPDARAALEQAATYLR
jgi:hypothetical protein